MKTQLALPGGTVAEVEVERIRRVREAIGPDIRLMCDINQRWTVPEAISIGERIEPYHLHWLEDVTDAATTTPGSPASPPSSPRRSPAASTSTASPPSATCWRRARSTIVMIDLVRVGGITQWMKVAGMAEAFNLPVVSHLIPEVHVHLIAAIPNGHIVEYMPWTRPLFDNPPLPVKGEMTVPTAPGLGLAFTREINEALDRGR